MKNILLAASALAALSLASCKKEKDATTGGGTPAPAPVKYLKKLTETVNGTTKVYSYTYGNDHRLASFKTADDSERTFLAYDNAGNLTTIDETEGETHNVYTYSYTNGKPVSATFKSWHVAAGQAAVLEEDDVLTYTVTGNRVTAIHLDMTLDNSEVDFTLAYDANGELTQVKSTGGIAYQADFTYGAHKSPFPAVTPWILDQAGFSLLFSAKHEITKRVFDFPGTAFDLTENISYTFGADGYPTASTKGTEQAAFEYE